LLDICTGSRSLFNLSGVEFFPNLLSPHVPFGNSTEARSLTPHPFGGSPPAGSPSFFFPCTLLTQPPFLVQEVCPVPHQNPVVCILAAQRCLYPHCSFDKKSHPSPCYFLGHSSFFLFLFLGNLLKFFSFPFPTKDSVGGFSSVMAFSFLFLAFPLLFLPCLIFRPFFSLPVSSFPPFLARRTAPFSYPLGSFFLNFWGRVPRS